MVLCRQRGAAYFSMITRDARFTVFVRTPCGNKSRERTRRQRLDQAGLKLQTWVQVVWAPERVRRMVPGGGCWVAESGVPCWLLLGGQQESDEAESRGPRDARRTARAGW